MTGDALDITASESLLKIRSYNMKYILLSIVFLTFLAFSLSACGMMEGAGRDIEGAGESIQKSAQ